MLKEQIPANFRTLTINKPIRLKTISELRGKKLKLFHAISLILFIYCNLHDIGCFQIGCLNLHASLNLLSN